MCYHKSKEWQLCITSYFGSTFALSADMNKLYEIAEIGGNQYDSSWVE